MAPNKRPPNANSQIHTLETENEELKTRVKQLEKEVKNSKKKVEQAEAEKGELILEVGEMRPKIAGYGVAMSSVLDEKREAIEEASRLKKRLSATKSGIDTSEALNRSLQKAKEENRLKWHDEAKLRERISTLEKEKKGLEAKLAFMSDTGSFKIREANSRSEQHGFMFEGAKLREEALEKKVKELMQQAVDKEKMQEMSDEMMREKFEKFEELEEQLKASQEKIAELEEKLGGAPVADVGLKGDSVTLEKLEKLQEENRELVREKTTSGKCNGCVELDAALKRLSKENQELQERTIDSSAEKDLISKLQEQIKDLKDEKNSAYAKRVVEEDTMQIAEFQSKELALAKEQNKELSVVNAQLKSECAALTNERDTVVTREIHQTLRLHRMRTEVRELGAKNQELRMRLENALAYYGTYGGYGSYGGYSAQYWGQPSSQAQGAMNPGMENTVQGTVQGTVGGTAMEGVESAMGGTMEGSTGTSMNETIPSTAEGTISGNMDNTMQGMVGDPMGMKPDQNSGSQAGE